MKRRTFVRSVTVRFSEAQWLAITATEEVIRFGLSETIRDATLNQLELSDKARIQERRLEGQPSYPLTDEEAAAADDEAERLSEETGFPAAYWTCPA